MAHRAATFAAMTLAAGLLAEAQSSQPPTDPPQQQPPIFRTGTNLVRVDVTVTGRNGQPVRTLTADDFEIREDGQLQSITSFKLVEASGQPTDELSLPIRSPEHAAAEAARDDVRVFLIFWDDYHINEFVSTLRAREQLTKFVLDAFGPTDLVAFMDPLTPLDAIRFTRDRRALAEHVHKLKGRRGIYFPPRSVLEEAQLQNVRDIERLRAQVTAAALKGAMLHLGSIREGRKAIILISESLPLGRDTSTMLGDLQRTANDTNTAVYTVDPRGLQAGRGGFGGGRPSDTLLALAYASGGEPYISNDMSSALRKVVTQASAFYLLGYTPADAPLDGKFHEIKVRVKRSGLEVFSRSGYWAPRPADFERARTEAAAAELPPDVKRAFGEMAPPNARRSADLWVGVAPGTTDRSVVTLAWAPRPPSHDGPVAAAAVTAVVTGNSGEVFSGPVEPGGARLDVPPGPLVVTFTLRDAAGDVIDREVREVAVPNPADATLALGTPMVFRARNPLELRTLSSAAQPPAHAGREFVRTERLRVRIPVYGGASEGAVVSAKLLGARGVALTDLPTQRGAAPGVYEVDLTLTSVSLGSFLISIEARNGDERAEALVPFKVIR